MAALGARTSRAVRTAAGVIVVALAAGAPVAAGAPAAQAADERPAIVVETATAVASMSPYLTGVNNNIWFDDSQGLWDPMAQDPTPDPLAKLDRSGISLVRFPGGTSANLYDWKAGIGPQAERGCQRDGRSGPRAPVDSRYGVDEHMELVEHMGADALIMTPMANETAEDAADWVEYMNAPVGTNPRGGIAWAERRAANGHPEPYDVRHWEIGNEIHFLVERYWMSQDNRTAALQYIHGGTQERTDPLRRDCDTRADATRSDGAADQRVQVLHPPVVPGSQTITVDGAVWTPVDDLSVAGPTDRVYAFDAATGEVRFGDGTHGAIPPRGTVFGSTYTSGPHPGFRHFQAAMKAADPDIDVIATWAPVTERTGRYDPSFPELMARAGLADRYDGVTSHPYTDFQRDFGPGWASPREGHDETMLGEAVAGELYEELRSEVDRWSTAGAYTAVSEFGALWFGGAGPVEVYPAWASSMSHVTYMGAQWTRYANRGLPFAIGNTATAGGLRGVLGEREAFVYSGDALTRELMTSLVDRRGTVVSTRVDDAPMVAAVAPNSGAYPALHVTAARGTDGRLRLLVVNADPVAAVTATVVPAGFAHSGRVEVGVVQGRDGFTDGNTESDPDAIRLVRSEQATRSNAFAHSFPAASVTLLTLTER